jgi:hypothetical protein
MAQPSHRSDDGERVVQINVTANTAGRRVSDMGVLYLASNAQADPS